MIYVWIASYIVISTIGLAGMKASSSIMSLFFMISGMLYASGAALWVIILRSFPLSIAFPVASSGLIVSTTLVAWLFFKEKLGSLHVFGLSLILLGIILVSRPK